MKYSMHIVNSDSVNLSELPSDFVVVFRQKGGSLDIRASHICVGLKGISKARQGAFLEDLDRLCGQYKTGNGLQKKQPEA